MTVDPAVVRNNAKHEADKVDLVSSCQNEHAAVNGSDGKSMGPVSQRTVTGRG
jgi:hypothetical protein